MAGGDGRGDDPGANLVTGRMRWRAMPEAAELARALATVSVADWQSVAGLSPLRHEPPMLLWAKLDRPDGAYFVKVRRTKTCKRRLRSLWKPSALGSWSSPSPSSARAQLPCRSWSTAKCLPSM